MRGRPHAEPLIGEDGRTEAVDMEMACGAARAIVPEEFTDGQAGLQAVGAR